MSRSLRHPRLVKDAGKIARHSWSFRLSILGAVMSAVELGMGVLSSSPPVDPLLFAGILAAVSASGAVARLVAQASISGDA